MQYRHASATHIGKVRQNNEDRSLCASRPPAGAVYCVADGMGGHAAGEVASALACATLDKMAEEILDAAVDPIEALRGAVAVANDVILRAVSGRPEWGGMGTTLTVVAARERIVHVAQVGDSRCYWVRGSQCKQVTSDQARGHVLFNVLGSHRGSFSGAEVKHLGVVPGDVLILATDGLSDYAGVARIAEAVSAARHPRRGVALQQVADDLVEHALASGGKDNVTVVAVEVLH